MVLHKDIHLHGKIVVLIGALEEVQLWEQLYGPPSQRLTMSHIIVLELTNNDASNYALFAPLLESFIAFMYKSMLLYHHVRNNRY